MEKFVKVESYGKILDLKEYIEKNYSEKGFVLKEERSLRENITLHLAGERNRNDCSIVAMSTVIEFHMRCGNINIDMDYEDIYEIVLKEARRIGAYPILFRGGTLPFLLDNVARRFSRERGFKLYSRNIYSISLANSMRKQNILLEEIRNQRPFILNISFGDYKNHSTTVIGYKIYEDSDGTEYLFFELADGWRLIPRYIDIDKFAIPSSATLIRI